MLRVFRHHIAVSTMILAAVETALLFTVLYVLLRLAGGQAAGSDDVYLIVPLIAASFAVMAAVGLYNRNVFFDVSLIASRTAVCIGFTVVLMAMIVYLYTLLWSGDYQSYVTICLASIIIHVLLVLLIRVIFLEVANLDAFKRRVLVIGAGPRAAKIDALGSHEPHFKTVGFLSTEGEPAEIRPDRVIGGADPGGAAALYDLAEHHAVDEIVVAAREQRGLPVMELLECKLGGVQVTDFLTFYEREAQRVDLDELQPSWLIYSDGFRRGLLNQATKRAFDIVVSGAFLLLTLPLTIAAAIAVKLDSPGPVLYRQERVGLNGRLFSVMKFRSMRTDAESDGVPQWAAAQDQRVTRVGNFLRRTRIDEIPQIFNVLKGDMSFVGPRPERPFFVKSLSSQIPFYNQRHRVKPGISGWAQINYPYGASVEDARAKLAYDLYYIKNGGLFLDIVTFLQTVRVVLWPDGVR